MRVGPGAGARLRPRARRPGAPCRSRGCPHARAGRRRAGAPAVRDRPPAARDSIMRLMRPLTMMATFSATSVGDADVLLDDEDVHLAVLRQRWTSISSTCATMTGARPSVGSSMTRSRGLSSSAREIATICCSPPDSCEPALDLRSARRGKVVVDAIDGPGAACARPSTSRRCSSTVSERQRRRPCGT